MRVHFFAYYSCTVQKVFVPLHHYTKTKNKQYKTMLTLQLIKEQRDRVISGLNKKHFNGAQSGAGHRQTAPRITAAAGRKPL